MGVPFFETSAKKHSTDLIRRVFEVCLKEVLRTEKGDETLKWLKKWTDN